MFHLLCSFIILFQWNLSCAHQFGQGSISNKRKRFLVDIVFLIYYTKVPVVLQDVFWVIVLSLDILRNYFPHHVLGNFSIILTSMTMLDLGSYIFMSKHKCPRHFRRVFRWSYILLHTCILIDAYSVLIKMKRKGDSPSAYFSLSKPSTRKQFNILTWHDP